MSFSNHDMALDAGTTVVTGPNAVGKSNLGRIIDVVRLVVPRTPARNVETSSMCMHALPGTVPGAFG